MQKTSDAARRAEGHFEGKSRNISKAKVRTFWRGKSGHFRAVCRRDQARHHAIAGFGVNARTASNLALDHPPSEAIGHQGRQNGVIELMTAAHGPIGPEQRQPGKSKVADYVEHLVASALIGVTQPLGIEQTLLIEHHRIFERSAERKSRAPKPGRVIHESEGSGAANLATEPFSAEIQHIVLATDHGIVEINFDLGAE